MASNEDPPGAIRAEKHEGKSLGVTIASTLSGISSLPSNTISGISSLPASTISGISSLPKRTLRRTESHRKDHLQQLVRKRRAVVSAVRKTATKTTTRSIEAPDKCEVQHPGTGGGMDDEEDEKMKQISDRIRAMYEEIGEYATLFEGPIQAEPLEVRMQDVSFTVLVDPNTKVQTVFNSSFLYSMHKFYKRRFRREQVEVREKRPKKVLDRINLVFQPGKMYLVLGAPGSGKSTLLQVIASRLYPKADQTLDGKISYNGRELKDAEDMCMQNAFGYISQLDKHAPRLTVEETFDFAYQCKSGGQFDVEALGPDAKEALGQANKTKLASRVMHAGLGLSEVKDTFVGDNEVRGVSGGQRRRVTVGEMYMTRNPVLCCDEISTGLDAASTFDMIQMILYFGRRRELTRVISLLQPSPNTFSLFDEVILLAEGMLLYSGPILEVQDYFAGIGYAAPEFMDCADFLQMISSGEGASLYDPPSEIRDVRPNAPTLSELADLYRGSQYAKRTEETLKTPPKYLWTSSDLALRKSAIVSGVGVSRAVKRRYANNFFRSTWLILIRFLKLWFRDRRVIFAGTVKNVAMGVSVGGIFANTDDPISIQGALFQAALFIMLGAMQSSAGLVEDRVILYKHLDANFFSVWPFVVGRSLAQLPQTLMDILTFGILLYFTIGLGGREDTYLFTYLGVLLLFAVLMTQQFSVFASFATSSTLQALSSCTILLGMLFGGFIIAPNEIPSYFLWIYWWNPFSWMYRALLVLEFRSTAWEDPDAELLRLGFVTPRGDPFGREWVPYCFIYMICYSLLCSVLTAVGLSFSRVEASAGVEPVQSSADSESNAERVEIPFKAVALSFHGVSYEVKASTKSEKLKLLNNVSGIFRPGRMCALMGTSGAGKTTLMDVIALRKSSGTITGDVLLNGWPQDPISFRRCSGYVFQFDVQTPQLTVKETILFSAKLRLDSEQVQGGHNGVLTFVDNIMEDVELKELSSALVGTDETGGLSFEQKKRLSIAVELAASPSVLFLDEPTSGLDARSALLVVKTLRKIANSGRTVCATIHQPSSTVFNMFDDLLLLKRGGKIVYHGPLGESCSTLVSYFESRGAPLIELGENPADWMLRVMSLEEMGDMAETYLQSDEYKEIQSELASIVEGSPDADQKIHYEHEFASTRNSRQHAVTSRLRTIYWRSPTYNLTRLTVSALIAFLLGSVFILNFRPFRLSEIEMRARLSTIFLSFIITGIMAIVSVLPVMTWIRDMYYRHRDAGMYGSMAMGLALGNAEQWFLVGASLIFTFIFLSTSHFGAGTGRGYFSGGFFGFYCFNLAIYSYMGQLFVCLVKPSKTAFILATVYLGFNNFFSGLIVRPQEMTGFFAVPYAITPGRYVYEGLVTSLYQESNDAVVYADQGSGYYDFLVALGKCDSGDLDCDGSAKDFVDYFFGGDFVEEHRNRNLLILGGILVAVRVGTWLALEYIRFS